MIWQPSVYKCRKAPVFAKRSLNDLFEHFPNYIIQIAWLAHYLSFSTHKVKLEIIFPQPPMVASSWLNLKFTRLYTPRFPRHANLPGAFYVTWLNVCLWLSLATPGQVAVMASTGNHSEEGPGRVDPHESRNQQTHTHTHWPTRRVRTQICIASRCSYWSHGGDLMIKNGSLQPHDGSSIPRAFM